MSDFNTESLSRKCPNHESDLCNNKLFEANNRKQKYCSSKCRDDFHNRRKRMLRDNLLPEHDAMIRKFQALRLHNNSALVSYSVFKQFGINLESYNELIVLDPLKGQKILRFGDFYVQRMEAKLFRVFTKKQNNGN